MIVAIRVEGNQEIGMGHVSRCLVIADEFKLQNVEVIFLVNDELARLTISQKGFQCKNVFDDISNISVEKDSSQYDLVIIDSYKVTAKTVKQYKQISSKVAIIDDLNLKIDNIDIIIHGSITHNYKNYHQNVKKIIGLKYVLIKKQYVNPDYCVNKTIKDIFISTGSTNINNFAYNLTNFLYEKTDFNLHLIIGPLFNTDNEVYKQLKNYNRVYFYEHLNDLSLIMKKCDLAISAGGVTIYELMASGIPIVSVPLVENQLEVLDKLADSRLLYVETSLDLILNRINALANGYDERYRLSKLGKKIIDGKGALRLVKELRKD